MADSSSHDGMFDGHDAQRVFADHLEIPALAIVAYLLFVRYGQRWMASRPPFELRTTARVWNVATAAFSICGACVCVPHLAGQLAAHGLWYTACADVYELAGYGSVALWAALFTWSKLFELFDTVLLVLRKRRVITLHWFHHSSVIAFAWAAWVYETPCALWYGSMNYSVHAIMYSYFFLTSTRLRRRALRVAPLITALQISQFIWGTVINVIAAASWAMPGVGCAIQLPILQIGAAMYVAYGLLFARLFVERYSRKAEGDGAKNGSNGAHHANGNGASLEPPGLKAV